MNENMDYLGQFSGTFLLALWASYFAQNLEMLKNRLTPLLAQVLLGDEPADCLLGLMKKQTSDGVSPLEPSISLWGSAE